MIYAHVKQSIGQSNLSDTFIQNLTFKMCQEFSKDLIKHKNFEFKIKNFVEFVEKKLLDKNRTDNSKINCLICLKFFDSKNVK